MTNIIVLGNSHAWTLMGWDKHASRDSVIMQSEFPEVELTLTGMAVTGATAHNLISDKSQTMAGPKFKEMLNKIKSRSKIVLAVYGEVDCAGHIRNCGLALDETVSRYRQFLNEIWSRSDVSQLIVASTTPHGSFFNNHSNIYMVSVCWNIAIKDMCRENGWLYLDIYWPFINGPWIKHVHPENHLHQTCGPIMVELLAAAVQRPI